MASVSSEFLNRGLEAYRAGDYPLAARILGDAVPQIRGVAVPGLWSLLGDACFRSGDFAGAIAACARAVALLGASEADWVRLGTSYAETDRSRKAVEVFEEGLGAFPGSSGLLNGLGIVWKRLCRPEKAVACYEQALQAASADPAVWRNLGNACVDLGELDRAIDAYTHAVRLSPRRPDYWNDLGAACAQRGDLASAVSAFLDAISLNPNDGKAWFNLAVARVRQLDPPAARGAYRRLKIVDAGLAGQFLDWVANEAHAGTEEILRAFEAA